MEYVEPGGEHEIAEGIVEGGLHGTRAGADESGRCRAGVEADRDGREEDRGAAFGAVECAARADGFCLAAAGEARWEMGNKKQEKMGAL